VGLSTTDYIENYDDVERACHDGAEQILLADNEFFDYGYSNQDVRERAKIFLNQLDETARIYLALHACADAPEPLYKIAERLRIPSYHYRAHQLGITRKKGEFGEDYETTQIGQWLTKELGLELKANPEVLQALKILCFESLQQYPSNGGLE
jgi:hypothetical protein